MVLYNLLLAHPEEFEPPTLGLEMRGFVITNSSELSRFVTLQSSFYKMSRKIV